ncbi:MAG: hypothetical protein U0744_14940 [Gemmataceae bacterium]
MSRSLSSRRRPGKEHERLKQLEGTWETSLEWSRYKVPCTTVYTMGIGGMGLVGDMESHPGREDFPQKPRQLRFRQEEVCQHLVRQHVRHADGFQGDYDTAKKTMTMTTEGPGPDGKTTKWRSVTIYGRRQHAIRHVRRRRQGADVRGDVQAEEVIGSQVPRGVRRAACAMLRRILAGILRT